ncbi:MULTISPECIES: DUF3231 family protein [unclassified Sutcliffiella]|uniref:DUF3231 family protein n=1 Tax=unclassified Sutcliffiella TaxID=2837532 RepID=UPI0030CD7A08
MDDISTKTMLARLLEHFLANKQNEEVHTLVQTYYNQEVNFINELTELFQQENMVVPVGYIFSDTLLKSDIQPPIVAWGNPTLSTESPYSEKLMMYLTNLLSSFGLTSNALGTSFSLRSDLPTKMTLIAKDIFDYAKDGGKLMVKNGWMEEPPQSLKSTK